MIQALLNLATRCRVLLADSSTRAQTLQAALLDGEPKDGLEHIEPFGFTACPMPRCTRWTAWHRPCPGRSPPRHASAATCHAPG